MSNIKIQGVAIIKDYKGNIITDKITKFSYTFSEEEDDVCEITIESDDRLLADTPAYQEGRELTVQWGWVNNPLKMSKPRKVFIFDTYPTYGETVRLLIVCHEKFAIAKMDVATNRNETTLKKGTPLILSSGVLSALEVSLEKNNPELQSLLTINDIKVKDNKIKSKKYQDDKRIVSYFNGNMSTFQSLRNYLNKLPGGPYVIESRDDNVTIKTRDLAQAAIRKWTYRGGNEELIEFRPEKKTRGKAHHSHKVGVTNWHPEKKEAINQESSADDKGQTKLVNSEIISDWSIFSQKDKSLQYAPIYGIPPNRDPEQANGVLASLGIRGSGKKFKKVYVGEDFGEDPGLAINSVAISTTAVAKPMIQYVEDTPAPKTQVYSTEHDSEAALAQADNHRMNEEAKAEMGTATMLGEPFIESGMIITIDGVSKKDEGNYYIFSCEHRIDADEGYILEIRELGRQGVNVKTVKPPVKTIEEINSPFPQYNPNQPNRIFDYLKDAKAKKSTVVISDQDIYVNKSIGPNTQDNVRVVTPKIKKPD